MYARFERFSIAISEISRHWHKLTGEEMEKYGLKAAHGLYLLALARHEEGLTAPQICELTGKDKSDVSRMMRIMEEKGIVIKNGGFQNRYGGLFCLTPQGREITDRIRQRASKAVEIAGSDLTDVQREAFYTALEAITVRIRLLSQEGIPAE